MAKIVILGAGGFGMALSAMAAENGHEVTLWSPFENEVTALREQRGNPKLLPGIALPKQIEITSSLEAAKSCDLAIIATPSFAVRETSRRLADFLAPKALAACVAKGFEEKTLKTLSQVMEEELPGIAPVMISGPSHAEEVAKSMATTVVAASRARENAERIQDMLMNPSLRIYVNDDVTGVELGGALKNVIALAAGCVDGLKQGDNAKAALMTRGITEIARLGVAMGAKTETFAGLSGIGDLIVTCTSMHSRNRRTGILIGSGLSVQEAIAQVGMTVEGYTSSKCAYELAKKMNVEMPIIEQVYQVLYEGKDIRKAVSDLMGRPKRHESEVIWLLSK